jgi:hypothetical protein
LAAFTLVVAFASERREVTPGDLHTLEAARFFLCPEGFDERSMVTYLQEADSTRYQEYVQAHEFDPARASTLLGQARARLHEQAGKSFDPNSTYELRDVQMLAGGYDTDRQGFWLSVPESVSYYASDSRRGSLWPAPYSSNGTPQRTVQVALEYPTDSPFAFDERGFMFVPVASSVAKVFARQYPDSIAGLGSKPVSDPYASRPHPPNVTDTGARKVLAVLNVTLTGCRAKSSQPAERGNALIARITGMRIHARHASDLEAGRLLYEWNEALLAR